ncbi:Vacuolar fusion protein mon1, partial [Teratosphaeriaceae sp. CCFEE 6253]
MSGSPDDPPAAAPPVESPASARVEDPPSLRLVSHDAVSTTAHRPLEASGELTPPPLPPRPKLDHLDGPPTPHGGSLRLSKRTSRPQLLSQATTALSLADVHTQSGKGPAGQRSPSASRTGSRRQSFTHFGRFLGTSESGGEDSASLKSYAPTLD